MIKNRDNIGTVALVGLGKMGGPMAACIKKTGYELVLHDLDQARSQSLANEIGAQSAPSLKAVGKLADIVITMLPNGDIVRSVLIGQTGAADGIASGLRRGSIVVDMSSSYPLGTQKLAEDLQPAGIALIDAPVSGGVRKAVAGTLTIMAGSDDDAALDRCEAVLSSMGKVLRVGKLGAGHALKALNNYVSAAGLAAICEAVIIGKAFGLDPETMIDAINLSTGRNNSTENKVKQFILNENFAAAEFALDLMAKDLSAAADLSEALQCDLPGIQSARSMWLAAKDELGEGADHTEIYRFLASRSD